LSDPTASPVRRTRRASCWWAAPAWWPATGTAPTRP